MMKKLFTILAALACLALPARAQSQGVVVRANNGFATNLTAIIGGVNAFRVYSISPTNPQFSLDDTGDFSFLDANTNQILFGVPVVKQVGVGLLYEFDTLGPSNYFKGPVTVGSVTGNGAGLTALNGSQVTSGTIATARLGSGVASSTTYLAGDQTYKTLAGAVAPIGSYPMGYNNNYGLNKEVYWVSFDVSGNPVLRAMGGPAIVNSGNTPTLSVATATCPEGGVIANAAGNGVCGYTESAAFVWSTKDYTFSWAFQPQQFTAGRWWRALDGTGLLATVDVPTDTVGFRFSTVKGDAHWIAYSAAATSGTNQVDSGVSLTLNTSYVLTMQKVGTTCTFYINGALVSTQTFQPTSQADGVWAKVNETDANPVKFIMFQDTYELGLY